MEDNQIKSLEAQVAEQAQELNELRREKKTDSWHTGWQVAVHQRDVAERELVAMRAELRRLTEAQERLTAALNDAIARCDACDGKGFYWIPKENVPCARCGPWRVVLTPPARTEAQCNGMCGELISADEVMPAHNPLCPLHGHFARPEGQT